MVVLALLTPALAACATSGGMTVGSGAIANPSPKYRNAIAVRAVRGGQLMDMRTVPGVANEPFKAALEATLSANGYLAASGAAKFHLDVEIQNLHQPMTGFNLAATADVTYHISGAGPAASYPVRTRGTATYSDSPIAVDRMRIASERAMRENIGQFLQALH